MSKESAKIAIIDISGSPDAKRIEKALTQAEGVGTFTVDLAAGTATVEYDCNAVAFEQLEQAVDGRDHSAGVEKNNNSLSGFGFGDTPLFYKNRTIRAIKENPFGG